MGAWAGGRVGGVSGGVTRASPPPRLTSSAYRPPPPPHLLGKPHLQQPIRLVQHQGSQILQPHSSAVAQMVDQAALLNVKRGW